MSYFTIDKVNPHVLKAEYAVRGAIVIKANEIEKEIKNGVKYPFDNLVYCNIGNPQALKQKPITFLRQVLACVNCPELIDKPNLFPKEVYERAKKYIDNIPGGVGAYSHSKGVAIVRQEVADFLKQRDGFDADPEDIYLTDGASSGVKSILNTLIANEKDGVMIPIPQYPLYSAAIELFGGVQVPYYLTEDECWSLRLEDLNKSYDEYTKKGVNIKCLAVINPGNPTGQCLSVENMQAVIKFCIEKKIVLMADEVYQENIWQEEKKFNSFKKVCMEMGEEGKQLVLASFHSTSKGFFGECGRRGGYMEILNFDQKVKDQLYKMASISLCSNLEGQITVGVMVNPPKQGEATYNIYLKEKQDILSSLKRRAEKLSKALNAIPGVSCQPLEGALYAFPQITILPELAEAAKKENVSPDFYYCYQLLLKTGLVMVPGSGFGEKEGTAHFRCTILPPEDQMDAVVKRLTDFTNGLSDSINKEKKD